MRHAPSLPLFALAAAAALQAPAARGQVSGAEPVLGAVPLEGDLESDPLAWDVFLGGLEEPVDVAGLRLLDAQSGAACGSFFIAEPPTLRLEVAESGAAAPLDLRLFVDVGPGSPSDPALLLRLPDGSWRCNDDGRTTGYSGIMPIIDFQALPGVYEVWVGSYLRELGAPAQLVLTADRSLRPGAGGQGWRGAHGLGTGEGTGPMPEADAPGP